MQGVAENKGLEYPPIFLALWKWRFRERLRTWPHCNSCEVVQSTNIHKLGSSWNDPSLCLFLTSPNHGAVTWPSPGGVNPCGSRPSTRMLVLKARTAGWWLEGYQNLPGILGLLGTTWYYLRLLKYTTCILCEGQLYARSVKCQCFEDSPFFNHRVCVCVCVWDSSRIGLIPARHLQGSVRHPSCESLTTSSCEGLDWWWSFISWMLLLDLALERASSEESHVASCSPQSWTKVKMAQYPDRLCKTPLSPGWFLRNPQPFSWKHMRMIENVVSGNTNQPKLGEAQQFTLSSHPKLLVRAIPQALSCFLTMGPWQIETGRLRSLLSNQLTS